MASSKEKKKPAKTTSLGRRPGDSRTLSDLNRHSAPDSDSDDDDDQISPHPHTSEMQVQEPSKCNDVDEIFNQAKQQGVVAGSADNPCPCSSTTLPSEGMVPPVSQPPETIVHNIIFWHDGFRVNDGPIRRLDDPANASFLESIKNFECPKELEPAEKRSSINVNLIKKDENSPESIKITIPFQGVGRRLGSSDTSPLSMQTDSDSPAPLATAPAPYVVDQNQPSTPIQIRFADGTNVVAKFNYHHTMKDIRAFVDASKPGESRTYQLQTVGFPPKELNDVDQTIEEAGLANSVIIQKR